MSSALINDGYDNLNCFLHRGILYAQLKFWMLAICDFETVVSLERYVFVFIPISLLHEIREKTKTKERKLPLIIHKFVENETNYKVTVE